MTNRVINFNAGPSTLPLAALQRARDEFLDIEGSGMSILEHSHRGALYEKIHNEAIALLRVDGVVLVNAPLVAAPALAVGRAGTLAETLGSICVDRKGRGAELGMAGAFTPESLKMRSTRWRARRGANGMSAAARSPTL